MLKPGLDGFEVSRAIRSDASLKETPVVLLSALGESRLVDAVRTWGARE
ncbi:MAG: hypothetical protein INH41_11955 [Myxococcaceae bacterium]|nr:hypothetical protein [Myxococcaceae bacterium]MCA3013098.1 hypothetical protein [Myxococcaceae bacterium]